MSQEKTPVRDAAPQLDALNGISFYRLVQIIPFPPFPSSPPASKISSVRR